MDAEIIDRGRGPELKGTRVTVYRIMDFVREGSTAEEIADQLNLTAEQVQAALAYIDAHQASVDLEYARILERVNQGNPPEIDAGAAKTEAELKKRILARRASEKTHAGRARQ
jgi:uncharacterized protein (DUF433 family)